MLRMSDPEDLVAPVVASSLRKALGGREILRGVTIDVRPGECFGLLGPNGAGKTTLLRVIAGLAKLDAGTLSVLGMHLDRDAMRIKSLIGFVSQEDSLDSELTAREILDVQGIYHGLGVKARRQRSAALLALAGLQERGDATPAELSGGMRRRLQIARALVAEPRLLILDEPSVGLDPRAREVVWDLLTRLRSARRAVLISTHYLDEAQALCDRVAILNAGRLAYLGPATDLSGASLAAKDLNELYMELTKSELTHESSEL
jgi:lipooligosaccharide transport system ATP-binding protein